MSLQSIQESLPAYAKDIKLNLSSLLNSDGPLTKQQLWGSLLASAIASKNKSLIKATLEDAQTILSNEALHAAKVAAILMGMNNVYYRFSHSMSDLDYTKMPANLRMTMMATPGIDKIDFELYAIAVSAVNGCGYCMDAHEKSLINLGLNKEQIQTAGRIAGIMSGVATALDIAISA